jgi:Cu/Zn superoxide dismutase
MHLTLGGDTLKRITKAALGGVASCALILGATQAARGVTPVEYYYYGATEPVKLVELSEGVGPFENATATLRVKVAPEATNFKLEVQEIAREAWGNMIGAHLHTGPCVERDYAIPAPEPQTEPPTPAKAAGSQAGPHYNHETATTGDLTPENISTDTEVWFDLRPSDQGAVTDSATVPFLPIDLDRIPGVMSIVIHVEQTDPSTGKAGDRQACMPLNVSEWALTTL